MRVQRSARHLAALGLVLFLGSAAPLFAQIGSRQSPGSPAQGDIQAREWALSHVADEVNKHFKKEQVSVFAQISADFTRLQVINNEMMQTVFDRGKVDLKLIASTTAEINKRAVRLSGALALPRIDEKVKSLKPAQVQVDNGIQASLLTLDKSIMSFIGNPLFRQPKVVDARSALTARNDLNLIIRLSEQLKTSLANQPADSKLPVGDH
jgi:hypothetical protein